MSTATETKEKPIEIRMGTIKAVAWKNETDKGPVHDVSFRRIYKDADGHWKESDRFSRDELLKVARVAELMADKLYGSDNG